MNIHLETERLLLRDLEESDAPDMFDLNSDPEVHKFLGNNPQKAIEEAVKDIANIRQQYKDNGIGRWAVIDKRNSDFIGWVGLKYEEGFRAFAYNDIGFRLKRKFWGRGYATEAAKASLNYGFDQLNLSEIFATAHTENIGSNKALQKIGLNHLDTFKYEKVMVHWYGLKNPLK